MISQVIFGDRLDFDQQNGITTMFLNRSFSDAVVSSGDIERDIRVLMTRGYAE